MKRGYRRRAAGRKRETPQPKRLFAQPEKDFYRLPDLVIRGGMVVTDGCRRILDLTPQKISLDMGAAVITLYGENLRIESLARRRLLAAGTVRRIELEKKWKGGGG